MNTNRHRLIAASSNPRVSPGRAGFILPALMILALVGMLFGLGRVLLYRYQCQIRIDRQHELEKRSAVRSALRWIETRDQKQLADTEAVDATPFECVSRTGRRIDVQVRSVKPIYPADSGDFSITDGASYAYACVTRSEPGPMQPFFLNAENGCKIGPGTNTAGEAGWISVDMSGTGSWLDEVYGRRYMVDVGDFNAGGRGDEMRLSISPVGSTAAIGLTMKSRDAVNATVDVWHRDPATGVEAIIGTNVLPGSDIGLQNGKGLQIAGNQVIAYHWVQITGNPNICGTYTFSPQYCTVPESTMAHFRDPLSGGSGKALRMTLEVKNTGLPLTEAGNGNTFKRFQVLPAYEFEVLLNWEESGREDEVATVVHVSPSVRKAGRAMENKAYIYDTPGVSVRGYARGLRK